MSKRFEMPEWSIDLVPGHERHDQHRALLLLAMQDPGSAKAGGHGGRSIRAVARAMGKSPTIVRKWSKAKRWAERIEAHGETAQQYAITIYRARYLEQHGREDLRELGALVSLPMTSERPTEAQEGALHTLSGMAPAKLLPPDPPDDVADAAQAMIDEARTRAAGVNTNLQTIGLSAIEVVRLQLSMVLDPEGEDAKRAKAAGLRVPHVKLSDLPRLQRMLRDLAEEERRLRDPGAAAAAGAGPRVIDSVRVSITKQRGGTSAEILEAVRADLADATVMVEQLLAPTTSLADLEPEAEAEGEGDNAAEVSA